MIAGLTVAASPASSRQPSEPEATGPDELQVCVGPGVVIQCRLAADARPAEAGGTREASGSGAGLPAAFRTEMEDAFGADFSAVRVHQDDRAQAMGALAYTRGDDIHVAPGQYDPGSQGGRDLLGHELTHVVQQRQGRVAATTQARGVGLNDDAGLEREADEMGARAARGERLELGPTGGAAGLVAQRKEGWTGVPANEKSEDVGTIRRVPLEGLTSVGDQAGGRAIALIPAGLDPAKPVEVLLHLHGYGDGWTNASDKGTHQLEQQLEASGRVQMIGLLPQGTQKASFSTATERKARPLAKDFDASLFIDEALGELATVGALAAKPATPPAKVVVSAHSGGGEPLGRMLAGGTAGNPDEVLLFEAINGPVDELPRIKTWLTSVLTRELGTLQSLPGEPEQLAFLDTSLRFRAFHRSQGMYAELQETGSNKAPNEPLKTFLDTWFAALTLPSTVASKFRDNYQVVNLGPSVTEHSRVVGSGRLASELAALVPAPAQPPPTPQPQPQPEPESWTPYEPTTL